MATRKRSRRPLAFAALFLALLFVGGVGTCGIIRFTTPEGDFVVDTDDPDFRPGAQGRVGQKKGDVAHQTALKARETAAKHQAKERQVVDMPEPAVKEPDLSSDLQAVLDQELSRLPDIYRVGIVLCDLEGKTRKEAARQISAFSQRA